MIFLIGTTTYRPRRTGERKRKSVRGCICGPDLAVIALKIVKKGEGEIEGVTTDVKPRRLGPKRASYIRKVFALRKTDDVRKYVVRREVKKGDKTFYKSPKIQRLITEKRLRRKKLVKRSKLANFKKAKEDKAKYDKILSKYIKEKKSAHHGHHAEEAAKEAKPVAAKPAAPKKEEKKVAQKEVAKDAQ
jgi:small subunit ribosomal protein S6e